MKKINRIITVIIAAVLMLVPLASVAGADGSYSVDTTYVQLKPGETGTVVVSADNAAGKINWSSEGVISEAGTAWLDNGVQTIQFTAGEAGTAYIHVTPDPESGIATYDNEVLDYGYTIQIDVIDDTPAADDAASQVNDNVPEAQAQASVNEEEAAPTAETPAAEEPATVENPQTDTQETEDTPTPADNDHAILTDQNTAYDGLSEEDRLYTTVDGQELYIIQYPLWQAEDGGTVWNDEVFNLDRLTGFEYGKVNYKGLEVDVFTYKDFPEVFVLKNLATDVSQYYTLGDNQEGFKPLPYVTVNGRQYIVQEYPEGFTVPEGYSKVEMTLGASSVQALKPEGGSIALRGYNVLVSPGLESTDPSSDIYYIYCLVDGETQLYSYDSGEGTLQRASILVYDEIPVEPETVIVYETVPETQPAQAVAETPSLLKGIGWDGMQIQVKALLIALAVAIILIIILIIALAVMSHRLRKNRKAYLNILKNRPRKTHAPARNEESIPPRTKGGEDEDMFSYVKTDGDEFDINDLN